jgi:hypothetical protein
MEVISIEIPYKMSNSDFKVFAVSDIHAGTIHCVEHDIKRKVQEIKETKNAMWIGCGDYAEFITPTDPRWDGAAIADWVKKDDIGYSQERWVIDLLEPIKDKCIGMLYGNHEVSIHKHSHQDVAQHICDGLGVPNLGYSAWVHLHFARENSNEKHLIKGCFTHGTGNAITEGAKINNLMRFMKSFDADFYGYGHVHDYIPKSFTRLITNAEGRIRNKVAIGATTGCWFRTYTQGINASYGEMKCYPPSELCLAVFEINPNTGFIDVSRSV